MADAILPHKPEGMGVLGDQLYDCGTRLDDPSLARLVFQKAAAVHEAYGNLKGQADALSRLCSLDPGGTDDGALAEKAVELYLRVGDDRGSVFALNAAAQAAHTRRETAKAKAYWEEALQRARGCGYVDGEVGTLMGLAKWEATDGAGFARAKHHLLAASELIPKLTHRGTGSVIFTMLADAELAERNTAGAEEYYRQASKLESAAWPGASAELRGGMALLMTMQGRLDDGARAALEEVRLLESQRRRMGSARSQAQLYQDKRPTYLRALSLAAAAGDGHAALEVVESARSQALAATLNADPAALAKGSLAVGGELDRLLRSIAAIEDGGPDPFQATGRISAKEAAAWNAMAAQALQEDHARLADLIGTALLRRAGRVESIRELRARLGPTTHAVVYDVEWGAGAATVYAVWVPPLPDTPVVETITLDTQQVRWIRQLANPDTVMDLLAKPTHPWQVGLARLIPERLKAVLATSDSGPEGTDLVMVPAGEMWSVPFAAIRIGDVHLVERATVTLAPSLAVAAIASTRKVRPVRRAVAVLDTGLRGTSVERDMLKQYFRLTEVPPLAAPLVKALDKGSRYELGVISAHGDHVRGLAHSLRLGEQGRLFAGVLLRCEVPLWWVMGACWSGALDHAPGHEPVGLPTVALLRGARAVIGALHRVPDRPTGRILASTYGELADGAPAPAALRTAQREYLKDAQNGCPLINWAPLVSIGAPGSS
ncbi:CHAT domain-containing protein [Micromonospora sp. CPCC 206061]|uniref:CHAT domain-containing protein n=1 Tax=Micromonospora sp. CPCC 206061 TaxID=3122410 RepID=UPI002FEE74CD